MTSVCMLNLFSMLLWICLTNIQYVINVLLMHRQCGELYSYLVFVCMYVCRGFEWLLVSCFIFNVYIIVVFIEAHCCRVYEGVTNQVNTLQVDGWTQ